VGKAYKFGPEDFQFNKPVAISITYAPDDMPAGAEDRDLALGRESGGQWKEVSDSAVDTTNHTISGSATGFSSYGVYWTTPPSNSAGYSNLVNLQVCKVLDATRELNIPLPNVTYLYEFFSYE